MGGTSVTGLTPRRNRWDLTPSSQAKAGAQGVSETTTPSRFSASSRGPGFGSETPTPSRFGGMAPTPMRMNMETPTPGQGRFGATPMPGAGGTRWD
jgi:hypothetical protein